MSERLWRRTQRVRQLPGRVARLVAYRFRDARARRAFHSGRASVDAKELTRALDPHRIDDVLARLGRRPLGVTALPPDERRRFVADLHARFPDAARAIVARADAALAHRFDLLGSGPTELGPSIDWKLDFKTGFRWPNGYYRDLRPVDLENDADVKVPWELSRCQHWVTLGQAYWLTENEAYAEELAAQLRSWLSANPVMGSINWVNAMEAAIRIVNWLWAMALFRDAVAITRDDRIQLLAAAVSHGRFIAANLERWHNEPASNHYLSDLVGLVYLGVLLPEVRESADWTKTGLSGLLAELPRQVHPDGVNYECSLGYHRLTTEIFASAFALCRQNGIAVPEAAWARLSHMVEFVGSYARPDGTAPIVGDADDGRLHILTPAPPDDHRHLLAFGGGLFARPDLAAAAGSQAHEAAWWFGLTEGGGGSRATAVSRAFPSGGFYVMRDADRYLLAVCCRPDGPTGHAHNDTLSFEIAALGQPWIVDSGSYVYTASADWRHRFRSTSAHNTVTVDGAEMNEIDRNLPFARGRQATPRVLRWESGEESDVLEAEHDGYCRLPGVGVHRRRFAFDKRGRGWTIDDTVEGSGRHRVQAFLHFAPGLRAAASGRGRVTLEAPDGAQLHVDITGFENGRVQLEEGWTSRSYGKKMVAAVLRAEIETELPLRWRSCIVPVASGS